MQVAELGANAQVLMLLRAVLEGAHQLVNFVDFLLVLLLLQQEGVLLQQKQVDAVQTLVVVVGRIDVFVILVLHLVIAYIIMDGLLGVN